jgi:phosphate/sulfate permease
MTLLIVIIALALIFDYINGFHDAANSIATVVSTKVLTPFQAVLWAALFNSVAFWIFKDHAVANSISKTVYKDFITLPVIFSGLLAAIFWNLLTWWYGIPSSSSHTLIGGFAGAAITHGLMTKGYDYSWAKIVDADTIIKTILFIFLAPLIGIVISIFITVVTIMRNVWWRLLIISLVTFATVLMFDQFEHSKLTENVEKFFGVDKYNKEIKILTAELEEHKGDTILLKKISTNKAKLEAAQASVNQIQPLLEDYDKLGYDKIASIVAQKGLLTVPAISKIKDAARNANDFLVYEAKSTESKEAKAIYDIQKVKTEEYKEPLKLYLAGSISIDSAMIALNAIYPIEPKNSDKVKAKIVSFNIQKSFASELDKADNKVIVNGIIGASILFMLIYLYVEKFKTPTALTVANMFKKLQLFSSAAFSIGHGGNDAQKVMGIIGAALIANGSIQDFSLLPGLSLIHI